MALIKQVVEGASSWQNSHSYSALVNSGFPQRVSNGGNLYQLIQTGTSASSGGPTGTSSSITDGTCKWKFLTNIDFTSVQVWVDAAPGNYTQDYEGSVWNCGEITTPNQTFLMQATPGSTTNGFSTILTAAPGESWCDNPLSPAVYDPTKGAACRMTASGAGSDSFMFYSNVPNFIIKRLQIKADISSVDLIGLDVNANTFLLDSCLIDMPSDNSSMIYTNNTGTLLTNCVVYDRATSAASHFLIDCDVSSAVRAANLTIVAVNSPVNGQCFHVNPSSANACIVKDCAIFGYGIPFNAQNLAGSIAFDHCIMDVAVTATQTPTAGFGATDNGGNIYSATASAVFKNAANDLRLLGTSAAIGASSVDTTDIPSGVDAYGTIRGASWDIGALEFVATNSASAALTIELLSCVASFSRPISGKVGFFPISVIANIQFNSASAIDNVLLISSVISLSQSDGITASPLLEVMHATASLKQQDQASATVSFLPLSASGSMTSLTSLSAALSFVYSAIGAGQQFNPISSQPFLYTYLMSASANMSSATSANGLAAFEVLRASIQAVQQDQASAALTIEALTATATGSIPIAATGRSSIFPLSCSALVTQQQSIITLFTMSSSGLILGNSFASAAISFLDFRPLIRPIQEDDISATCTLGVISTKGVAVQQNKMIAANSINIVSKGASSTQATVLASLELMVCTAAANNANQASSRINIFPISIFRGSPKFFKAESGLFLAADGSGLLLKADISVINLTQSDAASATDTFAVISTQATAMNNIIANALNSIEVLASSVAMTSFTTAQAKASINISAIGVIGSKLIGLATIPSLSVSHPNGPLLLADSSNLILLADGSHIPLAADVNTPNLTQQDQASVTDSFMVLTASGTAVRSITCHASGSIGLSASAQMNQSDPMAGLALIQVTASAIAVQNDDLAGSAMPLLPMYAFGAMQGLRILTLTANIDLQAVVVAVQQDQASGTAQTPVITASGTAVQGLIANGGGIILPLSSSGFIAYGAASASLTLESLTVQASMQQQDQASATLAISLVAASAAAQQFNSASALLSIATLLPVITAGQSDIATSASSITMMSASGTAIISGSVISSIATIGIIASGELEQINHAQALAELDAIFSGGGSLWKTPTEFVEGEDIVYWRS